MRHFNRLVSAVRPALVLVLASASFGSASFAMPFVPATAQRPESATITDVGDWVERNGRVSFDLSTAKAARSSLSLLVPGDYGRASALLALGASGSRQGREILIRETTPAQLEETERAAAALGLGELGMSRIAEGYDALVRLTRDKSEAVAGAAMVALMRLDDASARRTVAEIAAGGSDRAGLARGVLEHHQNPTGTRPASSWKAYYTVRWEAGRNFGLVDGKIWRDTLLAELGKDDSFLRALVLRMAADLELPGRKDHLLGVLMDGGGVMRLKTAVDVMPAELELLIDSGAWRPQTNVEWRWLVRRVLEQELEAYFPRTLAMTLEFELPSIRPIAAGLLYRRETRFEDILIEALESEDAAQRADAAYVIGAMEIADYLDRLERQCEDEDPWAAANAIGALIRMQSPIGAGKAIDLLGIPPMERPDLVSQYLFEVLAREAPDASVLQFVQEVAGSLSGFDRAFADAILTLNARPTTNDVIRRELPLMNPASPHAIRCASALGVRPAERDVGLMARMFPRQSALALNLELAVGLARTGHRRPLKLLEAAVWRLPWNESVLAAGIVRMTYGETTLMSWVSDPPASASREDLRRLGWAIGEYGGLEAVERLKRQLDTASGGESPEVQGAVLGAFAARTR